MVRGALLRYSLSRKRPMQRQAYLPFFGAGLPLPAGCCLVLLAVGLAAFLG